MKIQDCSVKLAWILWVIAFLVAITFVSIKIDNWGSILDAPEQSDFGTYYYSAKIITIAPEFLYHHLKWEKALCGEYRSQLPYLYLPAYAVLLRPLADLPYITAQRVWFWLSVGAIIATIVVMKQLISARRLYVLSVILWLFTPSIIDTLFLGQVNAFLALFLSLACVGITSSNNVVQFLAGMCLGIASAVKPFPIGLAIYAYSRKSYRYVAGTVVSLGLLYIIGFIALPLKVTQDYFTVMLGVSTEHAPPGIPIFWNQSIAAFWTKLSMSIDVMMNPSPSPNPLWVSVLSVVSSLIFAGFTIRTLLLQKDRQGRESGIYEIGLVLIAMLLLLPYTWWHYLVITPSVFIAIAKIVFDHNTIWWQRIVLPIGYLLIVAQRAMERIIPLIRINVLSSLMFFGLLIWWYVFVVTLKEHRKKVL